jgi:hypothetical protein
MKKPNGEIEIVYHAIDAFSKGFFECVLHDADRENDYVHEDRDDNLTPRDWSANLEDIDEEDFARGTWECHDFQTKNEIYLEAIYAMGMTESHAGYYFYHQRVGSGVYFTDNFDGEEVEGLSNNSRNYGNAYVTVYSSKVFIN